MNKIKLNRCYQTKIKTTLKVLAFTSILIALSSSCSSNQGDLGSPENHEAGSEESYILPNVKGEADCEPEDSPEVCDWAMSTDLGFVGRIVDLKPIVSPSVLAVSGRQDELQDNCD